MTKKIDLNKLLPNSARSDIEKAIVDNLFNPFLSEKTVERIDGEVGYSLSGSKPRILGIDPDHDLNALIPAFIEQFGTKKTITSWTDILENLESSGVNIDNTSKWMSEQNLNFAPPIDFDAFVNYSQYWWTAGAILPTPLLSWNLDLRPEYYVMTAPKLTDAQKKSVTLKTQSNVILTGSGLYDELWTLQFINNNGDFRIDGSITGQLSISTTGVGLGSLIASIDTTPGFSQTFWAASAIGSQNLFKFVITNGDDAFVENDKFEIRVQFLQSTHPVLFIDSSSLDVTAKGTLSGVESLISFQTIDGIILEEGQRILVSNQLVPSENGIWMVGRSKWIRSYDADSKEKLIDGSMVWVSGGSDERNSYILNRSTHPSFELDNVLTGAITVSLYQNNVDSPLNDWQEHNYWVHGDDLLSLGFDENKCVQAVKPIISYDDITMSSYYLNDIPSNIGTQYHQRKSSFNQPPLFDLWRYDGTHAGLVSSIFFYQEDPDFDIDAQLDKRIKLTDNSDPIFGIGIIGSKNEIFAWKTKDDELKTAWTPSVEEYGLTNSVFHGSQESSKGELIIISSSIDIDNEEWKVEFTGGSSFSILGSRSGLIGNTTIGALFTSPQLSLIITSGSISFVLNDNWTFFSFNKIKPRYAYLNDGRAVTFPGGPTADVNSVGTWLTPLRMFQNPTREIKSEIGFGDLIEHFRDVIQHQIEFKGAVGGSNNWRNINHDLGLGGTIRQWNQNFSLLASMGLQDELTVTGILTWGEREQNLALDSIENFIEYEISNALSQYGLQAPVSIDVLNPLVEKLVELISKDRFENVELKRVYGDTTAGFTNWPSSLAQLNIVSRHQPGIIVDGALDRLMIQHHDGHKSSIRIDEIEQNKKITQLEVLRSDGNLTRGVFSKTAPINPYKGQIWFNTSTNQVFYFFVHYDLSITPINPSIAEFWFNRSNGELRQWDGESWILSASDRWTVLSIAQLKNSVILRIESILWNSVPSVAEPVIDLTQVKDNSNLQSEFYTWAALYGYDPSISEYDSSNAFTWNYSSALFPGVTSGTTRWFDIYDQYFNSFTGTIKTNRPDLEPWKLLGYQSESQADAALSPNTWASLYRSQVTQGGIASVTVKVVATANVSILSGLQTIDGIALSVGDKILLSKQTFSQFNGIYIVGSGPWTRSLDAITNSMFIDVINGITRSSTQWKMNFSGSYVPDITNLSVNCVRVWSDVMWAAIELARPGIKICVDPFKDQLIPPYVSNSLPYSNKALTTLIPSSRAVTLEFGDNSTLEMMWKNSTGYLYSLVREYWKLSPLTTLTDTWGNSDITIGRLDIDRHTLSTRQPKFTPLHGDKLQTRDRNILEHIRWDAVTSLSEKTIFFTVVHVEKNKTFFSIIIDGNQIGIVDESSNLFDINTVDITMLNVSINDNGIPFNLGDTISLSFLNNDLISSKWLPTTSLYHRGLSQLWVNSLRWCSLDSDISEPISALRGWSIELIHRLGSIIDKDSMRIRSHSSSTDLEWNLELKNSRKKGGTWISAVRVVLVSKGVSKYNQYSQEIPKHDGSDWIFRIETYNPRNINLDYYELDINGEFETWFALNGITTKLEWKKYLTPINRQTLITPTTIIGVQNVITFLYGVLLALEDDGFDFSKNTTIDAETTRTLTWQLEIEKFVDRVYKGMDIDQGHIINPFSAEFYVKTPIGILSTFDSYKMVDASNQRAYDVLGLMIPTNQLTVLRSNDGAMIKSKTPIYSAKIFRTEFENVVMFNSNSRLYDSFTGLITPFINLEYSRDSNRNLKPTSDGLYLSNSIGKENIAESISTVSRYYDAQRTFEKPLTANSALSLLGWSRKNYFNPLNVNDTTQFNFWKGLIQSKGTNSAINAFTNHKNFNTAQLDELWAWKLAEYGDAREKISPEIKLNVKECSYYITSFQFYDAANLNYTPLPLTIQVEKNDSDRWVSFSDLDNDVGFRAKFVEETITVDEVGTFYVKTNNFYDNVTIQPTVSGSAEFISSNVIKVVEPGEYTLSGFTWEEPRYAPFKLIDYKNNVVIKEISLWHPAIGIHSKEALDTVNIISNVDPARYTDVLDISQNDNWNSIKPWAAAEVGQVWWNTQNLGYVPYHDAKIFPTVDERSSRWGSIADWASIDVWQWTKSTVPPDRWDEKALLETGRSDIPISSRATGVAAGKKIYVRNRVFKMRPIAWSYSSTGVAAAHPALLGAEAQKLWQNGDKIYIDSGRMADVGLLPNIHISGWSMDKPVGEANLTDTLIWTVGDYDDHSSYSDRFDFELNIPAIIIGQILITTSVSSGRSIITLSGQNDRGTEISQNVPLLEASLIQGEEFRIEFSRFGLAMKFIATSTGVFTSEELVSNLIDGLPQHVYIREGRLIDEILTLPASVYVNDEDDELFYQTEFEWRAWNVPSKSEIIADTLEPRNKWKSYVGDFVSIPTSDLIISLASEAPYTLKNGSTVYQIESEWADWNEIKMLKLDGISDGKTRLLFSIPELIQENRVTVFTNGLQQNAESYLIFDNLVEMKSVLPEGWLVTVVYKAYEPTLEELEFDPDIQDDVSILTQYKKFYQHTKEIIKSADGSTTASYYYFWVADKMVAPSGQNSLTDVVDVLKNGSTEMCYFNNLINDGSIKYDSVTIRGLQRLVTKNDSLKLRIIKDWTLRNDPEEMSKKNTHVEWVKMRRNQNTKIPHQLWNLMVDATAGQDLAGNILPAQVRIEYDEKYKSRCRYGFEKGQIFVDTNLARISIIDTILNTSLRKITPSGISIPDLITVVDINQIENLMNDPETIRETLNLIWTLAKPRQINEILFNVLDSALSNNFELTDIIKTSLITLTITAEAQLLTNRNSSDVIF